MKGLWSHNGSGGGIRPEAHPNSCAVTKYLPKENCRPAEIVKWGWRASRPKESSPPAIFSIFCKKHHLSMNPQMAPSKSPGQPCGLGDQYLGHFPARHPRPSSWGKSQTFAFQPGSAKTPFRLKTSSPIATQPGKFCPIIGSVSPKWRNKLDPSCEELGQFLFLLTQLGGLLKDECRKIRRPRWRKRRFSVSGFAGNRGASPWHSCRRWTAREKYQHTLE